MFILKPEEMRKVDTAAVEAEFPELILMETAGRGTADAAARMLTNNEQQILVFAGKGNNGGDGLVAARYLDMWDYPVKVIMLAEEADLTGSTLTNYKLCQLRNIKLEQIPKLKESELKKVKTLLTESDFIIDAMLGTGLHGKVREPAATIIKLINQQGKEVLAVDIPSGIDGQNGSVLGEAVKANLTTTMVYPKTGLMIYPGKAYRGKLKIIDLGIPERFARDTGATQFYLTKKEARGLLLKRRVTGHKGTFGKVGILGGSRGMSGAPAMTGLAALRTGAGLVKLAVPMDIQAVTAAYHPELITLGFTDRDDMVFDSLAAQSDVMAVGPGLGQSSLTRKLVYELINEYENPLVIDADGLNVIDELALLKDRKKPTVLTPHPGEMARLVNQEIKSIEENRLEIATDFAVEHEVHLVLKGASSVIALPDGRIYINQTGNEGMATAGSGDVLTGIISSQLAQGLGVDEATIIGPYLHGLAGDLAKEELGSDSLIATDIIDFLPMAIRLVREIK